MNRFSQFVSSLLPGFSRMQIEEDIRILKDGIHDTILPTYENASEYFGINGFGNKDVKDLDSLIIKTTKSDNNEIKDTSNFVNIILQQQKNTMSVLEMLDNDLDHFFDKEVTKSGITYSHTNIIKYLSLCEFNGRYVKKLLMWTMQKEHESLNKKIESPFTQAELNWLFENRNLFIRSIRILSIPERKVKGMVKLTPRMVVIPEEVDTTIASVGVNKLDPMSMGFLPPKLNPIYHIGMKVAEYQAARYERNTEEKRSLEFRLLALKDARDGNSNPRLEQEIEYTENRIKKINYKISKFEEE